MIEVIEARGAGGLPLVIDSPHSGRRYPRDFHHAVARGSLRHLEDGYVDRLLVDAPAHGATVLLAHFPRSYIDVNRAEDDLDAALLNAPWPTPLRPSSRCEAGVGLIFRRSLDGQDIYAGALDVAAVRRRIEHYYRPYHLALAGALQRCHRQHGVVWHLNMHSMPAFTARHGPGNARADFCLGNLHGRSCGAELTELVADTLSGLGYAVSVNDPYAGVELVARYAAPAQARHSLQIEINRALYMDERQHRPHAGFAATRAALGKLLAVLALRLRLGGLGAAAE